MKIVFEHLTKRFPNRNKRIKDEVVAVSDFNFTIPDGKLVGLLGPSGCGKSTALNLICGLEKPTEGRIYFEDLDVTDLEPENRGVGLVFQNYALYPHLAVRQNIRFPLENLRGDKKLSKEAMEEKVLAAARLVQIEALLDRKPNEMSGGQQQRVAIARALVKVPKVLLLDEPLSNLDARLRLKTREEIKRIQVQTGITTVFVTHDQEEAMSISDMIVVMKDGVLQQMGRSQEVMFLGTPQINVFKGAIKGEKVYIGDEAVMDAKGAADREVFVAVRPEGFIVDPNGPLSCTFINREVMGRDTSVIASHALFEGENIRAIIPSEEDVTPVNGIVRFALKPFKVKLFDSISEERIRIKS